jgi:hypothetical protein
MSEPIVREYRLTDFEQVKRIHQQHYPGWEMPSIDSNDAYPFKNILEVNGEIRAAGLCSMEIESHMLLDKDKWTDPRGKLTAIKLCQDDAFRQMRERGVSNTFATVYKDLERTYGKRLFQLGWRPSNDGWRMWFHETTE